MSRRMNAIIVAAGAAVAGSSASAQIFTENFNDGAASGRWNIVSQQEGVVGPDLVVDLAFDYSSLGIPSPHGGDTIGAAIGVNLNDDGLIDEGETAAIYPNGGAGNVPAGDWQLDAHIFVWNDGNSGSTELGMIGAYLDPSNPVAPYQWGTEGGPLAWIYSGEGGSSADLARFAEGGVGNTGYMSLGDYNAVPPGSIAGFETGVVGSGGPAATDPRGAWVSATIASVGTDIQFWLNGSLVNTYDNSGGFYSAGSILLGATDPFNSANGGNRTIIDNVVLSDEVTIPAPGAAVLMGLGGVLLVRRRR